MKYLGRVLACAIALLALAAVPAAAQEFPTRPITIIIPWPAGGATDIQMRAMAEIVSEHLKQPIVIENKPGAIGTLAPAAMAANAEPDGYTLSQIAMSVLRQPFMTKTTYDPAKDFTYIAGISAYTFGVVVRSDSPWKTWQEFLDYAKAHPGEVTYTTFGVGSTLNITMERIADQHGIKFRHIPTRGTAENNAALLGGHVMASADGGGWAPLVRSGQFRLLVTWGEQRSKQFPDVPTLKETGTNIVESTPYGIAGPKGMDPKVVQTLYEAFHKAQTDPRHLKVLASLNQEVFDLNPEQYTKFVMEQIPQLKAMVERFGLAKKN